MESSKASKALIWGPLRNALLFLFLLCPSLLSSPSSLSPLLLLLSLDFLPPPDFSPSCVFQECQWSSLVCHCLWPYLGPSWCPPGLEAPGRHCFHKSSHILGPKSTYAVLIISPSINGEQLYALCVFPELHREPW